jgi:hypothetical protein
MKQNNLYDLSVKTIGALHCERRGFWHNKWIESLTPEQAESIYEKLSATEESFRQLRNTINHYTLVGEPEELELEDDGESHLRNLGAFARGGMTAVNESMGFNTDPPDYDPDY